MVASFVSDGGRNSHESRNFQDFGCSSTSRRNDQSLGHILLVRPRVVTEHNLAERERICDKVNTDSCLIPQLDQTLA